MSTDTVQPSDAQVSQASREHLHDIFLDDVTQKMAIGRATYAAGYGIDPRPYARPFPGTQNNVTMASQTPKAAGTKSGLINAAIGALGGAGATALIGAAIAGFSGKSGGDASVNVQPTIQPAEYRVIFGGEEGLKIEGEQSSSSTSSESP